MLSGWGWYRTPPTSNAGPLEQHTWQVGLDTEMKEESKALSWGHHSKGVGMWKGPAKTGVFSVGDRLAIKAEQLWKDYWRENNQQWTSHSFESHLQIMSCLNQSMSLDFRKRGWRIHWQGCRKPYTRECFSVAQKPLRALPALSPADIYALAQERHTLSPPSSNPCLTTFYLFHLKRHLLGKACLDDDPSPSITHCPLYQDRSYKCAGRDPVWFTVPSTVPGTQ